MKASVSALALALCLAGCATASADTPPTPAPLPAPSRRDRRRRPPADRRRREAFVAARREGPRRVRGHQQPRARGSTRPTSPTIPTRSPPISARSAPRSRSSYANEAARYRRGRRASIPTPSASSTSCAAASSCRRRPRRAPPTELNTISTRLQSTYGKGQGTLNGKPITGTDIEAEMGTIRNPGRAQGDVDQLARQCRRADARRTMRAWSRSPTQGAKELGYRRYRRDVALAATTCRPTSSPR